MFFAVTPPLLRFYNLLPAHGTLSAH